MPERTSTPAETGNPEGSPPGALALLTGQVEAALLVMPVGVVVQEASGKIVFCNSAAERILGLSRSQMEGRTSLDPRWRAVHEDGTPFPGETHPGMVALRTGEDQRDVVMGVHRPDGELAWISISASAIPGPDGRPASVVATFSDVSARVRAEQGYERLFHAMLNGFALHEIVCDERGAPVDYRFLAVNPAFERLTGLAADAVVGRTAREAFPGLEPTWIETYGRVALTGEPASFESFAAVLGRHFRVTAYRPGPGQFACIFSDETERKRAEERLRVKGAALASSLNGIAIAGLDGTLTWVNDAFLRMWGCPSREEALGAPVVDFWEDPAAAARVAEEVSRNGHWVGELLARRRDGSTFEAQVVTNRVDDEERRAVCTFASFLDVSERRRAEKALAESRDLLARFIRHSPIYAFIKEVSPAESRVLFASENFERMIGVPGSQMVGRTMGELFPAEFAAKITADDWEVVRRGVVLTLEEELGGRSYTTIKFPIVLDAKRLLAGYTIDVTDRRRAELAAMESERRFRLLAEATSEGVVLTEAGRVLECNERYAAMHGYGAAELTGRNATELVETGSRAAFRERLDSGRPGRGEWRARRKDGSTFPAEGEARLVPWQGRTVQITAMQDLTDRKRSESEVRRLARLYAALIAINEAIVRVRTTDELFREVSRALVEAGGFRMAWIGWRDEASPLVRVLASHGDETGYLDGIHIRSDERPEGLGPTGRALREGRPCLCNDFMSDPSTVPWREAARRAGFQASAAFPIRSAGAVLGALSVYALEGGFFGEKEVSLLEESAADISFALAHLEQQAERRRAEEEIRALNAELERRVEQRTAELEAANRELEAFSYSVSHDLRAPLRAIEGFAGMLAEDGAARLTAEDLHRLGVVRGNARRMSALIDDLLTFSRMGRHELRCGRVAMTALARAAFEDVVADPEARARIGFRLGELPDAEGDATLLRQVWTNLLSNAVKYSARRESPRVEVSAERRGDSVVYRVRDNGVGFDARYADKLFGVFQRLHAVTDFEGTGIGLALVKRIVERHEGEVSAEGSVDGGATFSFSLPAAKSERGPASRGSL